MNKSYEAAKIIHSFNEIYKEWKVNSIQYHDISEKEVIKEVDYVIETLPNHFKQALENNWNGFVISAAHLSSFSYNKKEKEAMLEMVYHKLVPIFDEAGIKYKFVKEKNSIGISIYIDKTICLLEKLV